MKETLQINQNAPHINIQIANRRTRKRNQKWKGRNYQKTKNKMTSNNKTADQYSSWIYMKKFLKYYYMCKNNYTYNQVYYSRMQDWIVQNQCDPSKLQVKGEKLGESITDNWWKFIIRKCRKYERERNLNKWIVKT